MKDNYRAWEINLEDFYSLKNADEQLRFLLKFAVLAPSSHNTQPWQFSINNNEIIIIPDFSRELKASDTNNRQLYISLGCALQNILIAGDYYGYEIKNTIEKSPTGENYFVRVKLERKSNHELAKKSDHFLNLIKSRVTNRNKHLPSNRLDILFISQIAQKYGEHFKIDLIKKREQLLKIADLSVKAGIEATGNKNFRRELSYYVKNNTTRCYTGMPCFGMGIPTLVSYLAPTMIRFFNMNKLSEKSDRKLLEKYTQTLIVISSKKDDATSWIEVGKIYQEISLEAMNKGLSTSPMAGIIQIGNYYQELQKILNTNFRPQFFCRLGQAIGQVPNSPRLPVEKVLVI